MNINTSEFMGVFFFTNWTKEEFVHLWNNVEYRFPPLSSVPMIMAQETAENIQEIRKRFAYDLAVREFYKSKEYKDLVKLGNKSGGIPPIFDEKVLEPLIQRCLEPLEIKKAKVTELASEDEGKFKASRAIDEKDNPNYVFKDENDEKINRGMKKLGKMPDRII